MWAIMAKGTRVCKVCGKKYEYCHTARLNGEMFRWQDVACSPEHGSEYFSRIIKSRLADSDRTIDSESKNAISEELDGGDKYIGS